MPLSLLFVDSAVDGPGLGRLGLVLLHDRRHVAAGRARRCGHLGMLLDAMLGARNIPLGGGLVTVRVPGQEVTADLDVIVGEFAVLVVVHAEELGLLGGTELQAGDEIDDLGDGGGHDKSVRTRGHDGGDLPPEDDEVAV